MNAVDGNLPEIVELILESNPDLSIQNKNGKTALDIAAQEARIYILGSRKGFDVVYKRNAEKIVSLLGGDISPFSGMINFQVMENLRVGYAYDAIRSDLDIVTNSSHEIFINFDFRFSSKVSRSPRYF